jgi:hypothetical protein
MEPHDDLRARLAAERFRRRRDAVGEDLARLVGPRLTVTLLDDAARAAALQAEFLASHRAAEGQEWACVAQEWPAADVVALTDTVHRLARNLRPRAVWLLLPGHEPQAAGIDSDIVLDNPLGFAALGDHDVRLLDRDVPAGLWLARHPQGDVDATDARAGHADARADVHTWSLEVWGEPWLSATTRALRGVG